MRNIKVLKETLKDFGGETSIAGINNCGKGKSLVRSSIWLVIFTVLGYYTVVGFLDIVFEYLEYPVITTTDISHQNQVDFPAVTICNLNRVNCHNAFKVMYDIGQALNFTSFEYSGMEKYEVNETNIAELNKTYHQLKDLVSAKVTNCHEETCNLLKFEVSLFWR